MATATAAKGKTPAKPKLPPGEQNKTFVWVATDKRGVKMRGEETAKNENIIKTDLRRRGLNPQSVTLKKEGFFGASGQAVTPREIAIFARQIAVMMQSGVPLVQSFDIIASGQTNPTFKKLLNDIKTDIEGGSTFAEALSKFPVQFDELFVNLVRAGEAAGVLDTVLDTVATYKERMEAIKGKIKKALFYPTAVIAVAILVSSILLIFVVPQFEQLFKGFGAELPAFTQMIVTASKFMTSYWWLAILVVGSFGFSFVYAMRRSHAFARFVDRMVLRLPIIGLILHQSAISRFARTLAITFKAGVPLVDALETVSGATGSPIYAEAVKRIRDDVSVGHQLNLAMRQVNLFPPMVVQMTAIGEEAGSLDSMLVKVAEFYEAEVNNAVDALSSLLEPFIMVIIGTLVGGMVIGMYLPIFKLASVVG
jgi:type IV pilus assembly protein PilC